MRWGRRKTIRGRKFEGEQLTDSTAFLRARISEALDPAKAPGKVKTLAQMTQAEREEMERLYGKDIKR